MKNIISNDTPIVMLTVGELLEFIKMDKPEVVSSVEKSTQYVYGLRGIRNLFNVSHATAFKYKETFLKEAISQNGRKIIVDVEKAIELFNAK